MFFGLYGVTRFIEDRHIRFFAAELDTAIEPTGEHATASCRHERLIICPFFACMVSDDHADTVHLYEHINTIKEFAYLCVGVLLAIKEVDDWIYQHDVGFVKRYLI